VDGRDLEVSPAYDLGSAVASVKARLNLNSETNVEVNMESADFTNRDAIDASMTVEHSIDAKNSIKPTFNLNSGSVEYEYTRGLGGDAELTVNANPGNTLNVQWDDPGAGRRGFVTMRPRRASRRGVASRDFERNRSTPFAQARAASGRPPSTCPGASPRAPRCPSSASSPCRALCARADACPAKVWGLKSRSPPPK